MEVIIEQNDSFCFSRICGKIVALPRGLSEKGGCPTELGLVRLKTANAIGLLPVKKTAA